MHQTYLHVRLDLSLGSLKGKSFTIRSKAFDNLNDLDELIISAPNCGGHTNEGNITFEKEAFMSSKTRNRPWQLKFLYTRLIDSVGLVMTQTTFFKKWDFYTILKFIY